MRTALAAILATIAVTTPRLSAQLPEGTGPVVISNTSVIDVGNGSFTANQWVTISENRITAIGGQEPSMPDNATVIDGSGRFLIPALWDMHIHPDDPEMIELNFTPTDRDLFMPQFVLWGVTGVRDMGGDWDVISDWRIRIAAGELLGPRIFAGGPLVDGTPPSWPESVVAKNATEGGNVVDSLIAVGVDFIKVYSGLTRGAFFAIAERARETGISFSGHVPSTVTAIEAANAGMASQEHLLNMLIVFADRDAIRDANQRDPQRSSLQRTRDRFIAMADSYDRTRGDSLVTALLENQTWVTPTLMVWRRNAWFEEAGPEILERTRYMPGYVQQWWLAENNVHLRNRAPELIDLLKNRYRGLTYIARDLASARIPMMTGTDTGGNPHLFPGYTVHEEMEEMVRIGISNLTALQAATINPATFLGVSDSLGRVEVGYVADLLLIGGNPMDDISATKDISVIFANGRVIDDVERQRRLGEIENAAQN